MISQRKKDDRNQNIMIVVGCLMMVSGLIVVVLYFSQDYRDMVKDAASHSPCFDTFCRHLNYSYSEKYQRKQYNQLDYYLFYCYGIKDSKLDIKPYFMDAIKVDLECQQ